MAEVGVLELKIKDNSGKAASGLRGLAGALSDVQTKAANSLGLSAVNTQLKDFAAALNRQKNTMAAIKSITAFSNAVSKLSSIKNAINFNVKPIADLKKAIGDGIKITGNPAGQIERIREAIGGDWGSEAAITTLKALKSVADAYGKSGTAGTYMAMSKAIKLFKESISAGAIDSSGLESVSSTIQTAATKTQKGVVDLSQVNENFEKEKQKTESLLKEPVKNGGVMKLNLQQFAEKGMSGGNWRDQMSGVQDVNEQVKNIDNSLAEKVRDVASALKELDSLSDGKNLGTFAAGLRDIASASEKGANSYHTLTYLATAFEKVKKSFTGFEVPSFQKLISLAQSLQENYNASEALKKLAEGMTEVKNASAGSGQTTGIQQTSEEFKNIDDSLAAKISTFARALKELDQTSDGKNLTEFASGLRSIASASEKGANSYHTLTYLATAFERVKKSLEGFSLPSFQKLIALAQALQDNYNAAEALKKLAAGMEAVKNAGENFKMPNVKGIEKIVAAMEKSGAMTESGNQASGGLAETAEAAVEPLESVVSTLQDANDGMKSLTGQAAELPKLMAGAEAVSLDKAGLIDAEEFNKEKIKLEDLWDKIEKLKAEYEAMNEDAGMSTMSDEAQKVADEFLEANDNLELMKQQIDSMKGRLGEGLRTGTMDPEQAAKLGQQIDRLSEKYSKLSEAQKEAQSFSGKIKGAFGSLKDKIKAMFPHLTNLAKQFQRIATRMALRAVIKQITSGFREGVENVYHYSKAVGTSLAPSMDSAASSLLQMKNSIGAAVAPLINALVPVLKNVVDWFITLVNYANQFFALMTGQTTWTKALATSTEAYGESVEKAGSAANDWLADFDELNVIPTSGGGGGSSATTPDYSEMFEEVEEFDSKIKETVGWIKDHMDEIKTVAIAIGTAIFAWKLSQAFGDSLSGLKKLSLAAGVALAITGIKLGYDDGFDIGFSGGTDDILKAVRGSLLTMAGGALIGFAVGGGAGAAIGAAAGLVVGVAITVGGYINGIALKKKLERRERLKIEFGGKTYTHEQLEKYMEDLLSMEVRPVIDMLDPYVRTAGDTYKQLLTSKSKFEGLLKTRTEQIAMNIPITVSINDLIDSANEVINDLNAHKTASLNLLQVTLTTTGLTDPTTGKALDPSELLGTIMIGESNAEEYMKELAENMRLAFEGELMPDVGQTAEELAQAYAEEMLFITNRAKQIYEAEKFKMEIDAEFDFSDMSLESAENMIKLQMERWENLKAEFISQRKTSIDSFMERKSYLQSVLESKQSKNTHGQYDQDIKELQDAIDGYDQTIKALENWEEDWNELIAPTKTKMMAAWMELVQNKGRGSDSTHLEYAKNYLANQAEIDAEANDILSGEKTWTQIRENMGEFLEIINPFKNSSPIAGASEYYNMSNLSMMDQKERYETIDWFKNLGKTDEEIETILRVMGETVESVQYALEEYEQIQSDYNTVKDYMKEQKSGYETAGTYTPDDMAKLLYLDLVDELSKFNFSDSMKEEIINTYIQTYFPTYTLDDILEMLETDTPSPSAKGKYGWIIGDIPQAEGYGGLPGRTTPYYTGGNTYEGEEKTIEDGMKNANATSEGYLNQIVTAAQLLVRLVQEGKTVNVNLTPTARSGQWVERSYGHLETVTGG